MCATIIIETIDGLVDSIYSDTDISICVLKKSDTKNAELEGPFTATLVMPDLKNLFKDQPGLDTNILDQEPDAPFFYL